MTTAINLERDINAFLGAYRRLLLQAPDSGDPDIEVERRIVAQLLDDVAGLPPVYKTPVSKPVCRFLDLAHAASENSLLTELTAASAVLAKRAIWRNKYRALPGRESLFQNFAFCDFIGPDGWCHFESVTIGLTLLGPHTHYPFHEHPARELYLLLSGTSDWAIDFQSYRERHPGDWLLHREMQPHSIRARDTPMLAVSVWRGDIWSRSRFKPDGLPNTNNPDNRE